MGLRYCKWGGECSRGTGLAQYLRIVLGWLFFALLFINIVEAQERADIQEARMAYITALADTSSYNNSLNRAVRNRLSALGWEIDSYEHINSRANARFFVMRQYDERLGVNNLIVTIPGTEVLKDVEVDLRLRKVPFAGSSVEEFKSYAQLKNMGASEPMVHRGFNDYTMSAFFEADEKGQTGGEFLKKFAREEDSHIFITGHSLGGAVATILGARLVDMGIPREKLTIYTYGAPAVGNRAFVEKYQDRLTLKRYVILGDPVKDALQWLNAGYAQFDEHILWKQNNNSKRFVHSMSEYLDAAIRNYYDSCFGGSIKEKEPLTNLLLGEGLRGIAGTGKIYLAPVSINLPKIIENDKFYMQAVAVDMFLDWYPDVILGRQDEAKDVYAVCQQAKRADCDVAAFISINGMSNKNNPQQQDVMVEVSLYTNEGALLNTAYASTNTENITPIECVLYAMARIADNIIKEESILP